MEQKAYRSPSMVFPVRFQCVDCKNIKYLSKIHYEYLYSDIDIDSKNEIDLQNEECVVPIEKKEKSY